MRKLVSLVSAAALLLLVVPAFAQTSTPLPVTPATMSTATPTPASNPGDDIVSGGSITIGEPLEGNLTFASPALRYTLEGAAGAVVSISLSSDDFDSYLSVETSDGEFVASNDDSGGERNSLVANITLPRTGALNIIVESYGHHIGSGTQEGAFTLSVTESSVNRIEYTQEVSDSFTANVLSTDYLFTGSAGDGVIIQLASEDFDSYLRLIDSNDNELITNDDSGGTLNSQIGPFILPSTGTYTIRASSLSGTATGAYVLNLESIETSSIAYGETVDVEFTEGDREFYFTFTGSYADIVSATVDSDRGVNTSLVINDTYNYQIGSDSDGGSGYDPELFDISLTSAGTYTLIVRAEDNQNGTVQVTLDSSPPLSLNDGAQTVTFGDNTTTVPLSFTADAGQNYRLSVAILRGDQSSSINLDVRQGENTVANANASTVSNLVIDFVTSEAGEVTVVISEYSYSGINAEISIQPLDS